MTRLVSLPLQATHQVYLARKGGAKTVHIQSAPSGYIYHMYKEKGMKPTTGHIDGGEHKVTGLECNNMGEQ